MQKGTLSQSMGQRKFCNIACVLILEYNFTGGAVLWREEKVESIKVKKVLWDCI